MARTRHATRTVIPAVNPEGLTSAEWLLAVGPEARAQNSRRKLIDAWERGEDPTEWRAQAQKREQAARNMVKP